MAYRDVYLIDELRMIAESTKKALALKSLSYIYAPLTEITNEIKDLNDNGTNAEYIYPLVAVVTDIEERKGTASGVYAEVTIPQIIFAVRTDPNYSAKRRANESFKQKLQPIYSQFIHEIHRSGVFRTQSFELIPHTKIDRFNWGKTKQWTDANISVDYIDAIEINNLNLVINQQNCTPKKT